MKVAVIGEKGGTGKTTFATNLAGWRARRHPDSKVVLIDADRQGSASYWVGERQEREDVPQVDVLQKFGDGLGVRYRPSTTSTTTSYSIFRRATCRIRESP